MSKTALLALLTAVVATIGYHLAQRQVAPDASPALVPVVAYLSGAAICGLLLLTVFHSRVTVGEQISWPALALGVAVVLLAQPARSAFEVGYVWMYRSGWTLATGALVVNVLATLALVTVGVVAFGAQLHWTAVAGAAICLAGLGVMSLRGGT